MFKGQQVHFANESSLKEHGHCPGNIKPAVPDAGIGGDLPIFFYLFIPQVFNDIHHVWGTMLVASATKRVKQFFLQGAHRLEGETYKLILEHQVGHVI